MGGREVHSLGFKLGNNRKMIVSCEYNEMVAEMMMDAKGPQISLIVRIIYAPYFICELKFLLSNILHEF